MTQIEVLCNSQCSSDYNDFIQSIGWQIEVEKHTGYLGGLVPSITGPTAPYFASFSDEVIFHVASLMPSENLNYIKHLMSAAKVGRKSAPYASLVAMVVVLLMSLTHDGVNLGKIAIVWVEDLQAYNSAALKLDMAVTIVIHPLPSRLYQIKVIRANTVCERVRVLVELIFLADTAGWRYWWYNRSGYCTWTAGRQRSGQQAHSWLRDSYHDHQRRSFAAPEGPSAVRYRCCRRARRQRIP